MRLFEQLSPAVTPSQGFRSTTSFALVAQNLWCFDPVDPCHGRVLGRSPDEIDDRIPHAREAEAAFRERWRRANGVVGKSSGTFLEPDRLLIDETFSDILALRVSELGVDAQSVSEVRHRRSHGEERDRRGCSYR